MKELSDNLVFMDASYKGIYFIWQGSIIAVMELMVHVQLIIQLYS